MSPDPAYTVWSYVVYLALSIGLTIWVAWTLKRTGRIFLVDAFSGNEKLADSVNHLLVVGFYLINVGFVALALRYGVKPASLHEAFEFCSTKVGMVLLILGGMHFVNIYVFSRLRNRGVSSTNWTPVETGSAAPNDSTRLSLDENLLRTDR